MQYKYTATGNCSSVFTKCQKEKNNIMQMEEEVQRSLLH